MFCQACKDATVYEGRYLPNNEPPSYECAKCGAKYKLVLQEKKETDEERIIRLDKGREKVRQVGVVKK